MFSITVKEQITFAAIAYMQYFLLLNTEMQQTRLKKIFLIRVNYLMNLGKILAEIVKEYFNFTYYT